MGGLPLFALGRARGSLTYMSLGLVITAFALLMAAAAFVMLVRPDKNADAGLTLDSIRIDNQADAAKAVDVIKRAINQVSDLRGTLGATQNRLDHTINNLS
jgi:flagellin-like hook-associated protein FlgL